MSHVFATWRALRTALASLVPGRAARLRAERTEQRLALALEASGMAIWELDATRGRVWWTEQGSRLFGGGSGTEADVEQVLRYVHPDDRTMVESAMAQALARPAEVHRVQARIVTRDKAVRWLEVRGQAFADAGRPGLRGSLVDVSERCEAERRLKEDEERFRGLSDASFEGIFVHEGGRIVDVNRAMCELSGHSWQDLVGSNGFEHIAPEYREAAYRNLLAEREGPYELEALARDGRRVPVEVQARSFLYRGQVLRVVAVRDLTPRRREAAVQDSLLRELEARNVELDRFGHAIFHGLKSPLITIRGFADHLERDTRAGRTDRLAPDAARIRDAVGRLQRTLDELQAFSRAGQPVGPPVAVPVEELVREALRLLDARAVGTLPLVDLASPLPVVYGDRPRLVQLFEQLLGHTRRPRGAEPESVRIEAGQPAEGRATLVVRVGAADAVTEDPYAGLEAKDFAIDGRAVGLALVKRIVDSHGGSVWREPGASSAGSLHIALPLPPAPRRDGALRRSASHSRDE